jgi:hypothetical protein
MAPPKLNHGQRLAGATASLELRRLRADIKQWLGAAALDKRRAFLYQALELEACQGMKVRALLMALPGIGKFRAAKILQAAKVPSNASVRSMGWRQREAVLEQLSGK